MPLVVAAARNVPADRADAGRVLFRPPCRSQGSHGVVRLRCQCLVRQALRTRRVQQTTSRSHKKPADPSWRVRRNWLQCMNYCLSLHSQAGKAITSDNLGPTSFYRTTTRRCHCAKRKHGPASQRRTFSTGHGRHFKTEIRVPLAQSLRMYAFVKSPVGARKTRGVRRCATQRCKRKD